MIRILNESKNYKKLIELEVEDPSNNIEALLNDIKETAQGGHTFDVVVDPLAEQVNDKPRSYEIDGDGSCHITKIKVSLPKEDEESSNDDKKK